MPSPARKKKRRARRPRRSATRRAPGAPPRAGRRGRGGRSAGARRSPRPPPFFFNDTATTEIYTLSLHDALPISQGGRRPRRLGRPDNKPPPRRPGRSEEHTSELQSPVRTAGRLLLEKNKHI